MQALVRFLRSLTSPEMGNDVWREQYVKELDEVVSKAIDNGDEETVRAKYRHWFAAEARRAGLPAEKMGFYVTDSLADMNVAGITRYLDQVSATV